MMMRIAVVLLASVQLAECAAHVARGSRKGSSGMGSTVLTSSFDNSLIDAVEEEIPQATSMVILFVVSSISILGAWILIEQRSKHSNSGWMTDQRVMVLYQSMVVISIAQGCLALYKMACGNSWQGLMDLTSAVVGYYVTQPQLLPYLPVYLAVSGVNTVADIIGLIWNNLNGGIVCIDMVRPALCLAGIHFAREFLIEKKKTTSSNDDLLKDGKNGSSPIDNFFNLAASSSMVQQAMRVLDVVDPALFGRKPVSAQEEKSQEMLTEAVDKFPEDDLAVAAPLDDPANLADLASGEDIASCDLLELPASELPAPIAHDFLDMGTGGPVEFASDDQNLIF